MHLTDLLRLYNDYAKANPVVAGLMGLFGMSMVTFFLVKIPRRIWEFLVRQCTTSLTFNNSNVGAGIENFGAFLVWFHQHHWSSWSRSYAMDGVWGHKGGVVVGAGPGNHVFVWKGRLCWLHRETMQQNAGTYQINVEIRITMLGRNRKLLMELVDAFKYRSPEDKIGIYTFGDSWNRVADVPYRPLDSVMVDESIRQELLEAIENFKQRKDWYHARGLAYKLTFLLHGEPGSGKTSIIKGLASYFKMNLALLNLGQHSDKSLSQALQTLPSNCMVAIEDFDSTSASHKRSYGNTSPRALKPIDTAKKDTLAPAKKTEESKSDLQIDLMCMLTPAGLFNALDGLAALDDAIIFMTTNHVEIMDEALLRPGRVDKFIYIGPLADREIRSYIALMYPNYHGALPSSTFKPQLGCDLQALYFEYRDNPEGFVAKLPSESPALQVVQST